MKAEELRIGNYVWDEENEVRQVIELSRTLIRTSCDWILLTSEVKPIPLTEEILLKCGFICTEESETSKGFSIGENIVTYDYLVYLTWLKRIDGKGLDLYPFYRNGRHIVKYLHQLQNLYHALTGEQLEVHL